jgi:hypothetical protein
LLVGVENVGAEEPINVLEKPEIRRMKRRKTYMGSKPIIRLSPSTETKLVHSRFVTIMALRHLEVPSGTPDKDTTRLPSDRIMPEGGNIVRESSQPKSMMTMKAISAS